MRAQDTQVQKLEEIDPRRDILSLELAGGFELSPTERLTQKFLVAGNNYLFAVNYYGPIEVYDIRRQKKVSTLHFSYGQAQSLASDGQHLYVCSPTEQIKPKDSDILLVRSKEDAALEGDTEFVGKTFRGLNIPIEFDQGYAKKYGLVVLSLPIAEFYRDSIVWGPGFLAEEKGSRLYIADMEHHDISMRSGKGYAEFFWKSNLKHDIGTAYARLREGKVLVDEQIDRQEEEDAFSRLWISSGLYGKGLESKIFHFDENGGSEKADYAPISVVHRGGVDLLKDTAVLGVQQEKDLLYVLTGSGSDTSSGVTRVSSPHRLLRFNLSFQRPAQVSV